MASDDTALCSEAVVRWHELLADLPFSDPGLERLRRVRVYGENRVCAVARPHFVTPVKLESERLACALVASALRKVCAGLWREPELLDELGVSDAERELLLIDPGFENIDVTDRFDAFVSKGLGFVEVQGGAPGGIGYHDEIARAFIDTALFEAFSRDYDVGPVLVEEPLRDALLSAWRDWGGGGDPTVAIIDWEDAPLLPEFELIRDSFEQAGLRTVISDPRRLSFEGGRLRAGGVDIDVVYRRLVIHDVLGKPDEARTLVDAARAGAVCLVNPFVSDVMGHKSIFDLLTGPDRGFGLTAAERNAIHNHVPWTRTLVDSPRTGEEVVSRDYVLEHRTSVVLKPAHEYGGHGVHLGWESEPNEWETIVGGCPDGEYVAQRRIWSHHERFPLDEPGFPLKDFFMDTDPYVFRGSMRGLLTRLSAAGVTNVTQGGSLVSTFVISPP